MLKPMLPRMTKRRILAVVVAAPFVVAALTGANGNIPALPGMTGLSDLLGRGASALALPDAATVTAGKSVRVDVLDNDTYRGARKAVSLRVTSTPTGLTARVSKQRLAVAAKPTTKAGTYTIKYRLTDTRGSKSSAKVRVRVTSATTPTPTTSPTATPTATPTNTPTPTPTPTPATGTLLDRINTLPVAAENRTGYNRDLFKHWNSGTAGISYCDTRDEVLIAESVVKATWSGSSCTLTGQWYSYYDGVTITNPSDVDMDHMVALAEAWDSGAYAWDAAKREAYANDQGDPRSLVGVTFSANRGKGDQDPAEWMPLKERCRYLGEWVAVKHRWGLTADSAEIDSMLYSAKACENVVVEVKPYTG